jgi:hypothetical protein
MGRQLRSDAATSRRSAIDDGDMRSELTTAKDRFKMKSDRKPPKSSVHTFGDSRPLIKAECRRPV